MHNISGDTICGDVWLTHQVLFSTLKYSSECGAVNNESVSHGETATTDDTIVGQLLYNNRRAKSTSVPDTYTSGC